MKLAEPSKKLPEGPKYLSIGDVARDLGISKRHVYELIYAGSLKAIDISIRGRKGAKSLRIARQSLTAFKESRNIGSEENF